MFKQKAFFIAACLFSFSLFSACNYEYGSLHIKLPMFRFYDCSKIYFKNDQAYPAIIAIWQKKLQNGFKQLFSRLTRETGVCTQQLQEQLSNPSLIMRYHLLQEAELPIAQDRDQEDFCYLEENEIDSEIVNFIKGTVYKHTTKRNIKIILTNQIPALTATYGSDLKGHYLFCSSNMYTKENIKNYYYSLQGGHGCFCLDYLEDNSMRTIEISNLLLFGLIEATSRIEHQISLMSFLITQCAFQGKKASHPTLFLCLKLYDFQSHLEAVLQSSNPLETALFICKSTKNRGKEKIIWKKLVRNIAQSYHANSIKKFKDLLAQMKNQSPYQ